MESKKFFFIVFTLIIVIITLDKLSIASDEAPYWRVIVHGEYGIGLVSGAYVIVFDKNETRMFEGTTDTYGRVQWSIPSGFNYDEYKVVAQKSGFGDGVKFVNYNGGDIIVNVNIGSPF